MRGIRDNDDKWKTCKTRLESYRENRIREEGESRIIAEIEENTTNKKNAQQNNKTRDLKKNTINDTITEIQT